MFESVPIFTFLLMLTLTNGHIEVMPFSAQSEAVCAVTRARMLSQAPGVAAAVELNLAEVVATECERSEYFYLPPTSRAPEIFIEEGTF